MRETKLMHVLALGLGAIWASWWTFFSVASAVGNVIGKGQPFSPVPVVVVLALLGGVFVAWRWPVPGGILFVAFGLFLSWASLYFFHNSITTTWFLVLTLAFPPLIAGLLLVANARRRKSKFA